MKKKFTPSILTQLLSVVKSEVAEFADFSRLQLAICEHFGEVRSSSSSDERDTKGRVLDVKEVRTWKLGPSVDLTLTYGLSVGIQLTYVRHDIKETETLIHIPVKAKKVRNRVPKDVLTSEQFDDELMAYQLMSNGNPAELHARFTFLRELLTRTLGQPKYQEYIEGRGEVCWIAGNAELVLRYTSQGISTKLRDYSSAT